ncbi:HIT family protein [Halobellus clavatus]|uniref:Bis(5'-nucleosidyl)-tetraphosphatase n=1 Tax=Halobellus clavatus TaxID=660517 RepID=A0A1H3JCI2_9EURY|nr:HIT domain-containing protein [Halobellus clavatus]SDY37683.1 bis(5'-nucleosidyl)-tetraphosphatase [Halobellus clavatus]
MDQVFAPWRIEWVERDDHEDDVDGCPFCVLPERDEDRDSRIVARTDHSFVILNNYPYNPGHVMVIPDRHTGEWGALSDAELLDHARLKVATIDALEAALGPDGVNAGENLGGSAAGGSIADHVHTHLVPRWSGDTNFMPVIGDTKVLVEALDDTYDRLHEAFASLPAAAPRDGDGRDDQGAAHDADPDRAVRLSFET